MTIFMIADDGEARVKDYAATTKGKTATLRVTIEVSDPYALAHMLESLERITIAQRNREKISKAKKPPKNTKPLAHEPLLALPPPDRK